MKALLFSLLFFPLIAHQETFTLDAGLVEVEGETMHMSDSVQVQAAFGELFAKKLALNMDEANLGSLKFEEDVMITFKDGGYLRCEEAEVDAEGLRAKLSGGVIYRNEMRGGLKLQAEKMGIAFTGEAINSFRAEESVRVDFLNDLSVLADCAYYQRLLYTNNSSSCLCINESSDDFPGTFSLEGHCRITNKQKDRITADEVQYNLSERRLFVKAPKGDFHLHCQGKNRGLVDFTAGSLLWERFSKKMTLKDHVVLNIEEMGGLVAEETVHFFYDEGKEVRKIQAEGETVLTLKKLGDCTIACYGRVLIDRTNGVALLEAPFDLSKQVVLQDGLVRIASDKMQVAYRKNEEEEFVPAKFCLEGNVHLVNHFEEEEALQVAMADKIEYFLQSKELFLTSNEGKRVLFLDRDNNLQMSATELKVKRSTPAQKGYIQGVGNVRFQFAQKESELIESFLHLSEASK